ncbi:hypothetical protein [Leuconostoc mesenteroides]|uniref:hypothetical protein n=1 Tax=Leuconostoc mesenteroides TaxID=1245 RepID=UPI001FA8E910|nr:hypothetical protein [Leuconostoc mesenteroides]
MQQDRNIFDFLSFALDNGGHVTRIDYAFNDMERILTFLISTRLLKQNATRKNLEVSQPLLVMVNQVVQPCILVPAVVKFSFVFMKKTRNRQKYEVIDILDEKF